MKGIARLTALAVALAATAACGDDDVASTVDAGLDAGTLVTPPTVPSLPAIACPAGWAEVAVDDDVTACAPWSAGAHETCGVGEAHFVGGAGCERVGTECAADGWPSDLPADAAVRYVRAGGPSGDGTRASPFATIADALRGIPRGTIVALAAGTYTEPVTLPAGVTLWGACVAETTLGSASATSGMYGRVTTSATGAGVRNVRITGGRPGIWVLAGGSLAVRDVIVDQTVIGGVLVQGELDAESLVVRDVRPAPDGTFGRGLYTENAGSLRLRRAVVERAREVAVFARGASVTVDLEDVAIVGTQPQQSDDTLGVGAIFAGGAVATLRRVVVDECHTLGINVGEADTVMTAEDLVVRGTASQVSDGSGGQGIFVADGGHAVVDRGLFTGNHHTTLSAYLAPARIDARDVVVADTGGRMDDGGGGSAAIASNGGAIALERALVTRNRGIALGAYADGSALDLTDVTVRDTDGQESDGLSGSGVIYDLDARGTMRRVVVERSRLAAVFVGERCEVTIEDLSVRDTESQRTGENAGRGLEAQAGARVTVARAEIVRSRGEGLVAFDPETTISLEDLVVRGTRTEACAETGGCPGGGYGVATRGAQMTLRRFHVGESALAGMQLAENAVLVLESGVIVSNPIGINVQVPGVDFAALTRTVELRDNERNVDADSLPIPDPSDPLLAVPID